MTAGPQHDLAMEQILACMRELITGEQAGFGNSKHPELHSGKSMGDIFQLMDDLLSEGHGIVRAARPSAQNLGAPMLSDTSREATGRAFETRDNASQQYSNFGGGMLEPVFSRTVQEAVTPNLQSWVNTHQPELLEAIKPLMRKWMDANLPRVVESVLKVELGRAVTEHLRSRVG